jgi:hypothetical protein
VNLNVGEVSAPSLWRWKGQMGMGMGIRSPYKKTETDPVLPGIFNERFGTRRTVLRIRAVSTATPPPSTPQLWEIEFQVGI